MTTTIETKLNPKIIPLGKGDDGRLHYSIQGQNFSVAECDKDRFEKHASDLITGRDKYYQFKANHSGLNELRALGQILILAGGTIAGVLGAAKCCQKADIAKAWKNTVAVLSGLTGFVLSSQVSKLCSAPGYLQMQQSKKYLETVDGYLENTGKNAPSPQVV